VDIFTKTKRSWLMSRIKNKDTTPEITVRSIVHKLGYRFRKNKSNLPGSPDIVLTKYRKVIFVHGCFWHSHDKCKRAARPISNKSFWRKKLDSNILRDRKNCRLLKAQGWKYLIIWGCQIKDESRLVVKINRFLNL